MITVENLSKQYGATNAVDEVSMQIAGNSITVIVGTSGSGKSTLLRMINRLVEPSGGSVLIDGKDTAAEPAHLLRRRIGYAIQGHGLFPHRTVAENIAIVPQLLGWDATRIRARVEELLRVFQLDPKDYAAAFPHELSGGQQQRVGVARALAAEPAVLLMDEPFGALDPIIRAKAQEDLLAIQRRFGTTIVLVTHDMDEAFHLGDRVAVMSQGRLLQYDRPAVLLTRPADPLVARMTGLADRAMRLLSLTTAGEAAIRRCTTDRIPAGARIGLAARGAVGADMAGGASPAAQVVGADGSRRAGTLRSSRSWAAGARPDARGDAPAVCGAGAAGDVPGGAAVVRARVRAADRVRGAADLRPGEPAAARHWRTMGTVCLAAAASKSSWSTVGLGRSWSPAPRRCAEFLPLSLHPGEHRPDLPAGGRARGDGAAGGLRGEAHPDRTVRLRAAADL